METGIRELKNNLSHYIRRVEAGEKILVTAHGRVVAELASPTEPLRRSSRFEQLIAAGVITPPKEAGDSLGGWPDIRLAPGSTAALIDEDRGEA
jgi:prevent-host-death family protein